MAHSGTTRTLAAVAVALLLAGCPTGRVKPAPKTDPATVIGEGAKKDAAIETEAKSIAANPADAQLVEDAAKRILDVLRLSPWAKTEATIKALVTERDTAKKRADDLAAKLDAANARTDQIIRLGAAGFGLVLIAAGAAIAILAVKAGGIFYGVGPMQAAAVGAAGAVLLFVSFAYGWALRNQTLVMGTFAACVVAAAAFWISNRKHHLAANKAASA